MIRIVRKPPIGNIKTDRIKAIMQGNHTLEEKLCMSVQVLSLLQREGFGHAGQIDWWIPLIDPAGHELTHFADGRLISDCQIIVESPYPCAADEYENRRAMRAPQPF